MTKPKRTLLDEVLAELPRKGFVPWYERLDADTHRELAEIRRRFWAGELKNEDGRSPTKTGLAYLLSKKLASRGIHIGNTGVVQWLERARRA